MTFTALVKFADFSSLPESKEEAKPLASDTAGERHEEAVEHSGRPVKLGGLVYNIQIVLPESRDQAVYDALFHSLRRHLL